MLIRLALEINSAIDHLSIAVQRVDEKLKEFFCERSYGPDVEKIYVGIILVGSNSDKFHPIRKFKYQKLLKIKIPGRVIEERNVIQYDIKSDYEIFCRLNVDQAQKYLGEALISSVDTLKRNSAKFSGFDLLEFEADLRACLQSGKYEEKNSAK